MKIIPHTAGKLAPTEEQRAAVDEIVAAVQLYDRITVEDFPKPQPRPQDLHRWISNWLNSARRLTVTPTHTPGTYELERSAAEGPV